MMKKETISNVLDKILDERRYQEAMKIEGGSHIVDDFVMGDALTAIRYNLNKAGDEWYINTSPTYEQVTKHLRKIAAICVQMGERYGMQSRDVPDDLLDSYAKTFDLIK